MKQINDATRKAMLESPVDFLRQRASLPGYQPLYGAPVLILISAPKELPNSPFNAALAAENMLIEATELGLGSCFIMSLTRALDGNANTELEKKKPASQRNIRFNAAS